MDKDYFTASEQELSLSLKESSKVKRQHRLPLPGFSKAQATKYSPLLAAQYSVGDVLRITLTKRSVGHSFLGLCLAIRRKGFQHPDCSVILRNVFSGVGMEVLFSFFYNRAYRPLFEDHQRKSFFYRRNKLLHLRARTNVFSRSKE